MQWLLLQYFLLPKLLAAVTHCCFEVAFSYPSTQCLLLSYLTAFKLHLAKHTNSNSIQLACCCNVLKLLKLPLAKTNTQSNNCFCYNVLQHLKLQLLNVHIVLTADMHYSIDLHSSYLTCRACCHNNNNFLSSAVNWSSWTPWWWLLCRTANIVL